jgi:hypothetical protein
MVTKNNIRGYFVIGPWGILIILFSGFVSCHSTRNREQLTNYMTPNERKSVVFNAVSKNQKYYNEVADVAEYIQEMSVYDEELDSTYIIHITLPPDYDRKKHIRCI